MRFENSPMSPIFKALIKTIFSGRLVIGCFAVDAIVGEIIGEVTGEVTGEM